MFKSLRDEFKTFIMRGNVLDLAVGVVIGSAFTAIVNSLVEDIITPIIVGLTGQVDLTGISIPFGNTILTIGNFLQAIINFLLVAIALFLVVKFANRFKKKEPKVEVEAKIPATEQYLKEIRDLLAKEKQEE